jgi:hypothetical protein
MREDLRDHLRSNALLAVSAAIFFTMFWAACRRLPEDYPLNSRTVSLFVLGVVCGCWVIDSMAQRFTKKRP